MEQEIHFEELFEVIRRYDQLPENIHAGLNSVVGRVLVIAVIIYLGGKDPAVAIMVALAFVLSLRHSHPVEENNVNEVTLWMQGSPLFENILKEFRFQVGGVSGGGWPGATRPMICRFNSQIEKYKPYLNEKNWYFTMGDTLEIY